MQQNQTSRKRRWIYKANNKFNEIKPVGSFISILNTKGRGNYTQLKWIQILFEDRFKGWVLPNSIEEGRQAQNCVQD